MAGLQWRGLPYGECTWEKYNDILKAGGPECVQQLKVSHPVLSACASLACTDSAVMLSATLSRSLDMCLPADSADLSAPPISQKLPSSVHRSYFHGLSTEVDWVPPASHARSEAGVARRTARSASA